jgi:hypothetical protein
MPKKKPKIVKVKQVGPLKYVWTEGQQFPYVEGLEEALRSLKYCPRCKGKLTTWGKPSGWPGRKDPKNKRCMKCGTYYNIHIVS